MVKDSHAARKGKEDESSGSKRKPCSGKNEASGSGSGRSIRETPSRKPDNSSQSPGSVRKSQRLENRTPPRISSSKMKKKTPSPLRRSDREKKIRSLGSKMQAKCLASKSGMKQLKGNNTLDSKDKKKDNNLKKLADDAKGKGVVVEQKQQSPQVGAKRKERLDARSYKELFKPIKKKVKVPDYAKKTSEDNCSDSGFENEPKGLIEVPIDGEESKEDLTKSVDGNGGVFDSDVEKHAHVTKKPCDFEPVENSQVQHSGKITSSSSKHEGKKNVTEGLKLDKTMMGNNQMVQNREEHLTSNELYGDNHGLKCNLKGITCGLPAGGEGTQTCMEDALLSVSSVCEMSFLNEQCNKCSRKRRLGYNSPEMELCSCVSKTLNDVDMISFSKDRGEGQTGFDVKHGQDIQQSDPLDVEQNTCAKCNHVGKLMHCCGKRCSKSYHPSCLRIPKLAMPLPIWYCTHCSRKRLIDGVHSVSEGIESVCDIREVQLSDSEEAGKQKQCLVKYKGLSHYHNLWVPEIQLIHEVPELLAKFREKKECSWKPEWVVPQRLLLKRSLIIDDHPSELNDGDANILSNGHCEWLVKWCGLDYDQATWEFEGSSCFTIVDVQRMIRDYETRHARARRSPLSGSNENQERRKGVQVKLGRLLSGVLSGADSCCLNSVNKLREYYHKCHNAVLLDEQDSVLKTIYLISSLMSNVHRPFLIISQHDTLSLWEAVFLRIDSSINVVVYHGSTNARAIIRSLEFHEEGGGIMLQVLLSSVEAMYEDLEEFKDIEWEAVIVDDCQLSSILSNSVTIKNLTTNWRALLVNAPLKDDVTMYSNILSLLEPDGNSNQIFGLTDSCGNINVLKERLSSYIVCARFLEYWAPVQISNLQLEHYCSLVLSNSTALRSFSKSDPVGSLRENLISTRKCCDHPYIVDPALQLSLANGIPPDSLADLGIRASGKLLLLDKILSEFRNQGLKVLILFQTIGGSARDTTGDILDDFLHYRFGADSYEHVDGGGVSSRKHAASSKFNREKGRTFFLLETRACLPSIKLSSVDAVIIFNSDWNPLNDMKSLQRIVIDSKIKQIKVIRLYCPYTVEEKMLALAKNDMILDSNLQGISPSTSHMLLMWGAAYLFGKLDEFHHENESDCLSNIVPEGGFLKDVCEEILSLFQNDNTLKHTFISVARLNGGSYLKNTILIGEQKLQPEDGVAHVFWTKLLAGKQPQWRYLTGSSQRNRKRVFQLDDILTNSEVQADEIAKKRKKMDITRINSPHVEGSLSKLNAANKDTQENSGTAIGNATPGVHDVTAESDSKMSLINEQRELFQKLMPTILNLCEILLLKDDVKILARQFLEYIVNNHRVTREPETELQAFKISLCWTVAAMLNQNIDHKISLAIAKEKLHFSCREEEADFMYSKLKLLKKMFLLRSQVLKISNSNNITSATNVIMRGSKENCSETEESLLHSDKEFLKSVSTNDSESDILRHIKKVKKKCGKLMDNLKIKHNAELEEFKKTWENESTELEKKYRMESAVIRSIHNKSSVGVDKLKILDKNYAEKRKELEVQISIGRKELDARQQVEGVEQQKKASWWLERVNYLAQEVLMDKPSTDVGQLPATEHSESCKHLNGTLSNAGKLLQENSASETSSICKDGATINSSGLLPTPMEVTSGNLAVEGSLEQHPTTPTKELDKDTNQINSVDFDGLAALETTRGNGTSASLVGMSTEPLPSPGMSLTEQDDVHPASMDPLPENQGLNYESYQALVDGVEVQVQHVSEPVPMSVTTPSPNFHQTGGASSGRLDNEPMPIQQESNSANTSGKAASQPASELAANQAVDFNIDQCETHTSMPRDSSTAHVNHLSPLQVPAFTISRLPSLSSDPLQNELERIRREIEETIKIHEDMKLQLISERDKEIEDIVAQICKKYDGKLKETDASLSLKRNDLQMNQNKVMMHKVLADAFKSKCIDTKAASAVQQGSTDSYPQLLGTRTSTIGVSVSGSPSLITPNSAGPSVRPVLPSSLLVPNQTTRSPNINSSAPTPRLQQVRSSTHASSIPLQSFRHASMPMSSAGLPPVSISSVPGQQPPCGNAPTPSSAPQLLVQTQASSHDQGDVYFNELLMEMRRQNENLANNLSPLPDNVQNSESWDVSEFGTLANVQLPPSTLGATKDVVCLSDDD